MQHHERTFCEKCGTWRFKEATELCFHCQPAGKVESPLLADASNGEPIVFGGHEIDAPGFNAHSFERAIVRALIDDLEIHAVDGGHVVTHRGQNGGYFCTRRRCTCKAGSCGQCCKHRAALCFHLDVREPALRKQWQAAERETLVTAGTKVGRKAVAA